MSPAVERRSRGSSQFNPLSRRSSWREAEGRDYLETHQMVLNSIQAVVPDLSKAVTEGIEEGCEFFMPTCVSVSVSVCVCGAGDNI